MMTLVQFQEKINQAINEAINEAMGNWTPLTTTNIARILSDAATAVTALSGIASGPNEASDGSWENSGKREVPPQFEEDKPAAQPLALAIAVYAKGKTVFLDFGLPAKRIGLGAAEARAIGSALIKHADTVEK